MVVACLTDHGTSGRSFSAGMNGLDHLSSGWRVERGSVYNPGSSCTACIGGQDYHYAGVIRVENGEEEGERE